MSGSSSTFMQHNTTRPAWFQLQQILHCTDGTWNASRSRIERMKESHLQGSLNAEVCGGFMCLQCVHVQCTSAWWTCVQCLHLEWRAKISKLCRSTVLVECSGFNMHRPSWKVFNGVSWKLLDISVGASSPPAIQSGPWQSSAGGNPEST